MKKKNILGLFICFLLCLIILPSKTFASVPKQLTVTRAETLSDLVSGQPRGFTIFTAKESGNAVVYCMDVDKEALKSGSVAYLTNDSDANDPGLYYILSNGYPSKYITSKNEADKYITQAAIWWYFDEDKLSNTFKNPGDTDVYKLVPNYIKPMVNNARSAKNNGIKEVDPSLKVVPTSNTMSLSSDGKYYESTPVSVSLTNANTYSVSVSGINAIITNESNTAKTSFTSSEKFKVRVPVSSVTSAMNLTVNVTAKGTRKAAKVYKTNDSSYQRVVALFDEDTTKTSAFTLKVNPNIKYVCKYNNGKYYDKDGNVTDKKTYESQCEAHSCEMIDNVYYGKNGNTVDENTFNNECSQQVSSVPNTASNIVISSVVAGVTVIILGTTLIYLRLGKNKKKAKKGLNK